MTDPPTAVLSDPLMPSDLPWVIYWRVGSVILTSLPHREVRNVGSSGMTDRAIVRPSIPVGATGWRADPWTAWQSMESLPLAWMPWLQRCGHYHHAPLGR